MSPFSIAHVIDQVVHDAASRMALDSQQRGAARDIPRALYIEQIADRLGVTKRQLYRYMDGSTSPSVATLIRLCEVCDSTLPVAWITREVEHLQKPAAPATKRDLVDVAATELQAAASVTSEVLAALADGELSPAEWRALEPHLDDTLDKMMDLKSRLRTMVRQ
jgi:transcriptional regulator with XRE-family HTH domain